MTCSSLKKDIAPWSRLLISSDINAHTHAHVFVCMYVRRPMYEKYMINPRGSIRICDRVDGNRQHKALSTATAAVCQS